MKEKGRWAAARLWSRVSFVYRSRREGFMQMVMRWRRCCRRRLCRSPERQPSRRRSSFSTPCLPCLPFHPRQTACRRGPSLLSDDHSRQPPGMSHSKEPACGPTLLDAGAISWCACALARGGCGAGSGELPRLQHDGYYSRLGRWLFRNGIASGGGKNHCTSACKSPAPTP